jgi:hypothetical protein
MDDLETDTFAQTGFAHFVEAACTVHDTITRSD